MPFSNTVFTRDFVSAYPKNVLIGNPASPTAIPWCSRKARRPPKNVSVYSGIFLALRASLVTPVGRRGIFRFYQSLKQSSLLWWLLLLTSVRHMYPQLGHFTSPHRLSELPNQNRRCAVIAYGSNRQVEIFRRAGPPCWWVESNAGTVV
jgi:hypothetical protein